MLQLTPQSLIFLATTYRQIRSDQALWVEGNWRKRCHHETSRIVQRVQNPPGQG